MFQIELILPITIKKTLEGSSEPLRDDWSEIASHFPRTHITSLQIVYMLLLAWLRSSPLSMVMSILQGFGRADF